MELVRGGTRTRRFSPHRHYVRAPARSPDRRPQGSGLLIASRWPSQPHPALKLEWPERAVTVDIQMPDGPLTLTNAHIPPGASNGWIKFRTIEGIVRSVVESPAPRILCGDFNAPQAELPDGRIITWAQRIRRDRSVVLQGPVGPRICHSEWDPLRARMPLTNGGDGSVQADSTARLPLSRLSTAHGAAERSLE
jgi:endonuclease/exonuclease/phosphatase family metal-dependent hydrolase